MSTKQQTGTVEVTEEEQKIEATEPVEETVAPEPEVIPEPPEDPPPEPVEAGEETPETAEDAPEEQVEDPPEEPASPENVAAEKLAAAAERLSEEEVKSSLESLLLVADKPLPVKRIQEATGLTPARIRTGLETLGGTYRDGVSGIVLHEVAGGYQLRTCASNSAAVKRLLQIRPHRLTRAALETLSIVAYRQPVTRPEVEEIRGVDSGAIMRALLERELIQVLGKKEEPGRPLLYGTTRAFLEFFDLKDLASLPTLREFHSLDEEHERIVEERYPEEEQSVIDVLSDEEPLEEHRSDDEEALEELDDALRDTRLRDKALRRVLNPDAIEGEPEDEPEESA